MKCDGTQIILPRAISGHNLLRAVGVMHEHLKPQRLRAEANLELAVAAAFDHVVESVAEQHAYGIVSRVYVVGDVECDNATRSRFKGRGAANSEKDRF